MATADRMLRDIKKRGLKLPEWGSGRAGQILNSDLERLLAKHSLMTMDEEPSWGLLKRMQLEEVQLAYRYDKMKPEEQVYVMQDDNEWIAEEKYNGCRMVITYHPKEGFRAFGRNRSKLTYLPIDYSTKILVNGERLCDKETSLSIPIVFDCELMTDGFVETQSGSFTRKTLNAAVAILQLNDDESHYVQKTTAPLYCMMFDALTILDDGAVEEINIAQPFEERTRVAKTARDALPYFFKEIKQVTTGKQGFLDSLLAQGKEGIILKNRHSSYFPGISGLRDKNTCIKVKRTMQGSFGDEIDAYVIGYTNGPEWDKRGMIAGLKLAVMLRQEDGTLQEHWVATVSGIPDEMRERLSLPIRNKHGETTVAAVQLKPEFYDKVLTIDGMDISARNRRISHAKVDWERGFRTDKDASQCIMEESFLDSQMF